MFVFIFAVIMTALLWATFASPAPTHALGAPSADWKGESILFDGGQYLLAGEAKAGESHGLTVGTKYYTRVEEVSSQPLVQKAHIIYFAPGVDPPTATTAQYVKYDYSSTKVFSNPQDSKAIDITPLGKSDQYASSCTVSGGVGWIICPLTVFLADGMDNIFKLVSGFIQVQPTTVGNANTDLYIAWNIMRTIANVAFIIVFLIIIYSQLTSAGVSNYGLKKLLPRLIIAAILVNLSFFITAIAVDISNVFGYSLQDIFVHIRQSTFNIDNGTWSGDTTTWSSIAGAVLSGGAITAGVVAFSGATAGAIGGAIYLLIPLLVGLMATILFVLLVLAARQAIIIILIVIAPLAFVAYLLPNTEKWFEKWRELFMTMLVFFPAFSLVFGGSQLAGGIIIQNATNIFGMIFGLAVQVAPLIVTPLLLKLSGGLLGRIAGMINDPRKGLMDRTKNWSNDRAEMHRQKSLSRPGGNKNPFRAVARRIDNGNREVKERTGIYTAMNDNRYNNTPAHEQLHELAYEAETEKKRIEGTLERDLKIKIQRTPSLLVKEMEMRVITDEAQLSTEQLNRVQEGLRANTNASLFQNNADINRLAGRTSTVTRELAATAIASQTAKRVQQNQLSEALLKNTERVGLERQTIRDWAGSIDPDNGAESALTYAVNLQR